MTVGVLPNLDKRGASEIVGRISEILNKNGVTAYISDNICAPGYTHVKDEDIFKLSDIIITVGGDGTIIRYAKLAAQYDKPILGINAGRLGFLATLEANEVDLISNLITGDYNIESRMTLSVKAVDGENILAEFTAVNDAVITSGFMSRLIDINAYIRNDSVSYRADGLIVSTPTGSTAYSMSAGGPIIDPSNDNITLTPICSHSLNARPVIISPNEKLRLHAYSIKRSDIYLSIDGRKSFTIKPGIDVIVTRSDKKIKLIKLNNRSFYKTLSEKFVRC